MTAITDSDDGQILIGKVHLWHSGLERWPRKRKVGFSNPCRVRPKS